jgi:hypothetical protein
LFTEINKIEDNAMKNAIGLFVRKALTNERGQVLPWIAVVLVGMLSAAGLSIDVGRAYVLKSQLQNVANAAALAAAGEVYNTSSTSGYATYATNYGAGSGNENSNSVYGATVTPTITGICLNSLMPTGQTCTNKTTPTNAVKVVETASIPTYFMKLAGINNLSITSSAMASMQGMSNAWNVAIIVDGTQSMSSIDTNCGGLTSFACAMGGVQQFLVATNPCPSGAPSCTPANANLRVALFGFPNISTVSGSNTFNDDSTCSWTFKNAVYTLPTTSASTYAPIQYTGATAYTGTYQITDWDTGYYSPGSSTGGLNANDNLVQTVGYGYNPTKGTMTHKGCFTNVGGESTYYGGVIYAAQDALLQAQQKYGGKNALIIVSDGEANAASSKFPTATSTAGTGGISVSNAGTTTYSKTAPNLTGTAGSWGTYPDYNNECQQAIIAAQTAAAAGTRVFAVAYGAEQSGCYGDTDSRIASDSYTDNVPFSSISQLSPCVTMENMANPESGNTSQTWSNLFYSDLPSGTTVNKNCVNNNQTATDMGDIFFAISANFTTPRLLPSNAQ